MTRDELKRRIRYDPITGAITRLDGRAAGWRTELGYIRVSVDGEYYMAHRLAWLYMTGAFPSRDIDHINRVKHDNRWENLREASRSDNMLNTNPRVDNTSRVTGVYWLPARKKWLARAKRNGSFVQLGAYSDWFDAVCARKGWEVSSGLQSVAP